MESDSEMAKKLQAEMEGDVKKARREERKKKNGSGKHDKDKDSSGSTSGVSKDKKKNESTGTQECPICTIQLPVAELEEHVNLCLIENGMEEPPEAPKDPSKPDDGTTPKPSFWKKIFGKKEDQPVQDPNILYDHNKRPLTMSPPSTGNTRYLPTPVPTATVPSTTKPSNNNSTTPGPVMYTPSYMPNNGQQQYYAMTAPPPGQMMYRPVANGQPYMIQPQYMPQMPPQGQMMYYMPQQQQPQPANQPKK